MTTRILEADVERACDDLARQLGWAVENYSQRRASKVHEGIPDRRYVHRGRGLRVWVELKAPQGKLTTAQYEWLTVELEAGGLATVIHSASSLAHLFSMLARRSSIVESEARRVCREWVDLTWQRGPREGKGGSAPRRRRRLP